MESFSYISGAILNTFVCYLFNSTLDPLGGLCYNFAYWKQS